MGGSSGRLARAGYLLDRYRPGCYGLGDVGESLVVVSGVEAQHGEGLVHGHVRVLSDGALGLLDEHAAVKSVLELLVETGPVRRGDAGDEGDAGYVRQSLTEAEIVVVKGADSSAEQPESAENLILQPHR